MNIIGSRIKAELKAKGITQKELSKRTGISPANLSKYINSKNEPRVDIVLRVAKALDVNAMSLIGIESKISIYDSIKGLLSNKEANQMSIGEISNLIMFLSELLGGKNNE